MKENKRIKQLAKQLEEMLSSTKDNWSSYDSRDFECERTAKLIIKIIKEIKEEK